MAAAFKDSAQSPVSPNYVRIWRRQNGGWNVHTEEVSISNSESTTARYGRALGLDADGKYLALGDSGYENQSGKAWVWDIEARAVINELQGGVAGDEAGYSVALGLNDSSELSLIVGVPGATSHGQYPNAGQMVVARMSILGGDFTLEVFEAPAEGTTPPQEGPGALLTYPNPAGLRLGTGVAIAADTFVTAIGEGAGNLPTGLLLMDLQRRQPFFRYRPSSGTLERGTTCEIWVIPEQDVVPILGFPDGQPSPVPRTFPSKLWEDDLRYDGSVGVTAAVGYGLYSASAGVDGVIRVVWTASAVGVKQLDFARAEILGHRINGDDDHRPYRFVSKTGTIVVPQEYTVETYMLNASDSVSR